MPISVTCPECDKALKIADTMAGKSFKCPGCKAVVKAPAASTPARPTNTTPAKKPAARRDEDEDDRPARKPARREEDDEDDRPVRKSSRRDDDEDDRPRKRSGPTERLEEPDEDLQIDEIDIHDTNVPENIQERIEQELTKGEKLYWVGMPSRRIVLIRSMWAPIAGLFIFLVCGAVALSFAMSSRKAGAGFPLMEVLAPGCFGLLFSAGLAMTPFYNLWKAKRTCYALTSRRAIVWQAGWFGTVTMENYNPARLANMWRRDMWFFGKGGGDLVFRSVTTITVSHSRRHGSSVSQSTTYYGFLHIENVKQIERLVREVLVDKVIDRLTS